LRPRKLDGPAQLGHGRRHYARIFWLERDGFAIEMDRAILHRGRDGAVGFGRDAGERRKVEVIGAKLIEQADGAVGFGFADLEVATAEILPGQGARLI